MTDRTYRGRRPTLTDEQALELLMVRQQVLRTPTAEEMAVRLGLPIRVVRRYLHGLESSIPKRHRRLLHEVG